MFQRNLLSISSCFLSNVGTYVYLPDYMVMKSQRCNVYCYETFTSHIEYKVIMGRYWSLKLLLDNPTPVMGQQQQQQLHNMPRVPQQPGQGGSMNLPSMVGTGPGQQPGPGQSAPQPPPPPPPPQPNQSGTPSGQAPQTIGPPQTVAAPQQGTPPGGPVQPSTQQVS